MGGLGFSSTGYNGSYGLAMTNNGAMVADRMTTGTLRAINIIGVAITGSTIDGGVITNSNGYSKIILRDGTIKTYYNNVLRSAVSGVRFTLYDSKGVAVMDLDSDGVSINKENTTTTLGYLGRGRDVKTGKEELAMNVNVGNIGCIAVQENTNGIYIRKIAASSAGAHISNLIMGGSYVGGSGEIKTHDWLILALALILQLITM